MLANIRRPLAASFFGSALALFAFSNFVTPAAAQVSGAVVVTSGPVQGRIAVGEPVFAPRPIVVYQPVRGRRVEMARALGIGAPAASELVHASPERAPHQFLAQVWERMRPGD